MWIILSICFLTQLDSVTNQSRKAHLRDIIRKRRRDLASGKHNEPKNLVRSKFGELWAGKKSLVHFNTKEIDFF